MYIVYRSGLYQAHNADPALMLKHGWRWQKVRNVWTTSHIAKVQVFVDHCEGEAYRRVKSFVDKRKEEIAASFAAVADIDIPAPPGLEYRPYQKAGIAFLLCRTHALNADVMRLGKTIQALGTLNAAVRLENVLIITPANAKINWLREYNKWSVHPLEAGVCEGTKNPQTPVTVCNYEIVGRHIDWFKSKVWDYLICDESFYLKNPDAQRTRLILGARKGGGIPAKRVIFLNGTPIFTRPVDLWTTVKLMDPQGLGKNRWDFLQRYCGACPENGWDSSGATHMEELQYRLRSTFMIRREKSDVMLELPSNRQTIILPRTAELDKLVRAERQHVRKNLHVFEALLQRTPTPEMAKKITWEFGGLDGIERDDVPFSSMPGHETFVATRQELALAKVPSVISFVEELLQNEPKVVVFAHHRSVVDRLRSAFPGCAYVYGGMSTKCRQDNIDRFRDDPKCRVFVGNIQAAGKAISLSAADVVVFAELSWVPSEMDQAEERVWDVTKDRPISIYRIVVEDSVDAHMAEILDIRQENIERAMQAKRMEGLVE